MGQLLEQLVLRTLGYYAATELKRCTEASESNSEESLEQLKAAKKLMVDVMAYAAFSGVVNAKDIERRLGKY